MNLVCSWGGVGTTMLLDFLHSIPGYVCNPARGYLNPLKHPPQPPSQAQRAVFLFGCPYLSVYSLFRRGYDALHYVNVNRLFPPELDYPEGDLWLKTCQKFGLSEQRPGVWVDGEGIYADRCGALDWLAQQKAQRALAETAVAEIKSRAYRDFDHFLEQGVDHFRLYEQWRNWNLGAAYPVLLVRYETLWLNLSQVFDFLEVPQTFRARFPRERPRQTTLDGLTAKQRQRLTALYGALAREVEAAPELVAREALPHAR